MEHDGTPAENGTVVALFRFMKSNKTTRAPFAVGVSLALLIVASGSSAAGSVVDPQMPPAPVLSDADKKAFAAFDDRVKVYMKLRERVRNTLKKPSDESKPEQIEAYKKTFQERVRAARTGAKQGDVFTPDIAQFIRNTAKAEFKGRERAELRETVLVESDAKGIPLRVNYTYPETKEQNEMPPTLLLKLPQLPKELKYRFVGRGLLLVDRDNGLIVDYITNALP
jgi:hypothetical protein